MDYRHVRSEPYCPLCFDPKAQGTLVCWPCYHDFDFRNGAPRTIQNMIDQYEIDLITSSSDD